MSDMATVGQQSQNSFLAEQTMTSKIDGTLIDEEMKGLGKGKIKKSLNRHNRKRLLAALTVKQE